MQLCISDIRHRKLTSRDFGSVVSVWSTAIFAIVSLPVDTGVEIARSAHISKFWKCKTGSTQSLAHDQPVRSARTTCPKITWCGISTSATRTTRLHSVAHSWVLIYSWYSKPVGSKPRHDMITESAWCSRIAAVWSCLCNVTFPPIDSSQIITWGLWCNSYLHLHELLAFGVTTINASHWNNNFTLLTLCSPHDRIRSFWHAFA